jgi:hypothetical protein
MAMWSISIQSVHFVLNGNSLNSNGKQCIDIYIYKRLVEIAQERFPELVEDQACLRAMTNRVHVAVVRSADELLAR